ncbi:porin family protein [Pedobacter sp. MW01-1-1]|uniref:porin family protein n=1 Tax=Pedobacter sp. MW01-1-1 TaxID=3383027 RepID=UPI003FED9429
MKKLLIGATVLLSSIGAFAQNSMSGSSARIGVKAGLNLSSYSGSGYANADYKNNPGYNFTFFGDFGVGNNFFIQPGISLQNKGAKIESTFTNGSAVVSGTIKQNVMVVEIPVNAVYRIPTGDAGAVQISAGPYIGFNVAGKNKYSAGYVDASGVAVTENENDLSFGSKTDNDLGSVDFGVNFGLAYRLNNGFLFGANYGLGITNLIPNDLRTNNSDLKNRVLGFSIGYSF